jgi:hypothetical protein
MGVSVETFRAGIGSFVIKCTTERTTRVGEDVVMGRQIWFMGQETVVLMVTGGVELNQRPPADQRKIKHILAHVRNQEKENKGIEI